VFQSRRPENTRKSIIMWNRGACAYKDALFDLDSAASFTTLSGFHKNHATKRYVVWRNLAAFTFMPFLQARDGKNDELIQLCEEVLLAHIKLLLFPWRLLYDLLVSGHFQKQRSQHTNVLPERLWRKYSHAVFPKLGGQKGSWSRVM
jgi:hypothetical protein